VFAVAERDRVRERLLEIAGGDAAVVDAAVTGSHASGGGDRWSDVDLAIAVRGEMGPALERWTGLLYREFAAVHHWDLPVGSTVYRVFLLPGWLEVDIAFTPAVPRQGTDHVPHLPLCAPQRAVGGGQVQR